MDERKGNKLKAKSGVATRWSRPRTLLSWCVFVLFAAGLIETWLVAGLAVPCRVAGGSMAEALLGVHRDVACGDCGCRFPCGTDVRPVAARAVCPNCGYAANDLKLLPDAAADRVLIDRTIFSIRAPRRWEVVAFRQPTQADRIVVKRVVGLPGESIEVRHGDVYADGRIQRKSLAQQRALAVLVHDADFAPTREPAPPPRWQSQRSDSLWRAAGGGFSRAADPDRGRIDWLVYHPWRESPITDLCGYNPSQPRREEDVHAVTDLMLSFRLVVRHPLSVGLGATAGLSSSAENTVGQANRGTRQFNGVGQLGPVSGQGSFWVRTADGRDRFEARLQRDAQRWRCRVFRNGQPMPDAVAEVPALDVERLVEVSSVDQQFLLAIDGRTVVACPLDRPESPRVALPSPVAIGAEGIAAVVRQLRVYRDVYYTQPIGRQGDRPASLAAGQYYVLGDNSPISEDSRVWPEPGIDAKLLIGKPLVAVPSIWLLSGGRWQFQVPNPAAIRYIQ